MTTTLISDHTLQALNRLIAQFKEKPKIEGIITSGVKQIQDLEDAAFNLISARSLQNATGRALDRYGEMLQETRGLQSDNDFRSLLFFKISKNISNGTPEELIKILQDLVQGEGVQYNEIHPAKITLAVANAQNDVSIPVVLGQIQQLLPAGVSIVGLSIGYDSAPFAFAGHPNLNARGFDTFPVTELGGKFVSVIL